MAGALQESKLNVLVSFQEGRAKGQQPALIARSRTQKAKQQARNRVTSPEREAVER